MQLRFTKFTPTVSTCWVRLAPSAGGHRDGLKPCFLERRRCARCCPCLWLHQGMCVREHTPGSGPPACSRGTGPGVWGPQPPRVGAPLQQAADSVILATKVRVHECARACVCMCVHVCMHVYCVCTCVHVCSGGVCTHVGTCVETCVCSGCVFCALCSGCVHARVYVCINVCVQ